MTAPTTAHAQLHARGIPTRPAAPGFGQTLRHYRERAGLSHVRFAAAIGVNHGHVSRLESGNRNPSRAVIARIVDALRLDTTDAARLYVAAQMLPPGVDAEAVVALVERGQG